MRVRFDVNDGQGRHAFIHDDLGEALASLTPESRPNWGGLNAAQMVEHLLWAFEVSTGRLAVAAGTSEEWQQKARAFLRDNRPMPRGFENPLLRDGLPPLRFGSLDEARDALITEARRFLDLSASDPHARRVHPVFGVCSAEEWSRVHFKHGVHHLLQFGLVEIDEGISPLA